MQTELPFHLLEALASYSEQVRYIEHGTKDEYFLPSDLLNDAWHFCERALQSDLLVPLSSDQRVAVGKLQTRIKEAPSQIEDEPHVVDNADWAVIGDAALSTLKAFGQAAPA